MTSGKNQSKLPKWFKGDVYHEGDIVRNPFSGEKYRLNAKELSMYDFIKGCEYTISVTFDDDILHPEVAKLSNQMRKGLDWFRETNARAYMILLD